MIKYWWLSIMDDSPGNDNQVLSILSVNNISVNISKFESSIVDRQSNVTNYQWVYDDLI